MKRNLFLLLAIGVLCACTESDILDGTIIIPDETIPQLPAYTEWGYNSFGAKYERNYFLASNSIVPCKVMYQNGKLSFSLIGYLDYYSKTTLSFIFPVSPILDYSGLLALNDKKINLAAENCIVKMSQGAGSDDILNVLDGTLHFKRVQLLSIDDIPNRAILSGTFSLRFIQGDFPETLSNGRFDMGITSDVFYAY
jgi:hypothetical protein